MPAPLIQIKASYFYISFFQILYHIFFFSDIVFKQNSIFLKKHTLNYNDYVININYSWISLCDYFNFKYIIPFLFSIHLFLNIVVFSFSSLNNEMPYFTDFYCTAQHVPPRLADTIHLLEKPHKINIS